ncbi:Ig-like domain-containing protein [Microbacterium sp. NPDC089190]|uniref:RCC1 domain-containing protein n=1 Tax=Microbacterium sp. NPDC089190 TaxID=3155063 RepID=UPI00344F70A5
MTASVPSLNPATPALSRRTVIAGAAWSIPVIVAVTATPAFAAASNVPTVTTTTPSMQAPAAGQVLVTAVVKDASGAPLSGQPVSFTGPSGTTFSPSTATTDGAGTAASTLTTNDAWALPGSSVTVTALSNGVSGSAPLTVLGANAYGLGDNTNGMIGNGSSASQISPAAQLSYSFPAPLLQIASGNAFSLAVLKDGTVWTVGANDAGQLGDGTTSPRTTWAQVPSVTGVVQVAAAMTTSYALLSDGTIRAWGGGGGSADDNTQTLNQLGNGTSGGSSVPVVVSGITTATQICASGMTAMALLGDRTVRVWGGNGTGQYGTGSYDESDVPVAVPGLSGVVQVAMGGFNGYALLSDGTIRSWGAGWDGALGNGTTNPSLTPTAVAGITTATRITAGQSTAYALLASGEIRAWGRGQENQLGNGAASDSSTPVAVAGINTATQLASGYESAYAILADGSVKAWGNGRSGQLGDPTISSASTPVTLAGTTNVTRVTGSGNPANTFLIVGDRIVSFSSAAPTTITAGEIAPLQVTVGTNPDGSPLAGQTVAFTAGAGTNFNPTNAKTNSSGSVATTLFSTDPWATPGSTLTVSASSGGYTATKELTVLGANAVAVGDNRAGRTGTGTPSAVVGAPWQLMRVFPSPITAIAGGEQFTLALLADGTVWAVGSNDSGQLGDGTTNDRSTWAVVPGISNAVGIAVATRTGVVLLANGTVMQWGASLDEFNRSTTLTPTAVPGVSDAVQIAAAGMTVYAVRPNGSVLAWGSNFTWLLGDGSTGQYRAAPGPVSGITNAIEVTATNNTALVRLTTGEIYAWGSNGSGALGNGTENDRSRPGSVSVPSQKYPQPVTGITTAKKIVAGGYAVYALLTSGEIRSWGWNSSGQLGDGTMTDRTTPVSVSGIRNAVTIGAGFESGYAILADGTSRAWGGNRDGQLGDNTTTNQSTPIVISPSAPAGKPLKGFGSRPAWTTTHFIF